MVHQAIYARLTGALEGVCPVYDHVPDDAAMPWVEIDGQMGQQSSRGEAKDWRGFEFTYFVSVASQARNRTEVPGIVHRIVRALSEPFDIGRCRIIQAETLDEGETLRGAVVVQILVQDRQG